ncbi:MAG TPA: trypsin-like peptidase domain-containing protein [Gaiellaceae bacterium]|nr:trypsin-like peptidase domain-containing protein [Gaiellaceae bacterium]
MDSEPTPRPSRRALRTGAIVAAAVAVGAGAGVGVYSATQSGSSHTSTTAAVVATQPTAAKTTTTTLEQLYKNVTPGVVDIVASGVSSGQPDQFGNPQGGSSSAEGTGFVYDSQGHIITNAHVVDGASSYKVKFQNGNTVSATLVGKDDSSDTAVLKVDVPASQLHPLTIGDSATVQPGEAVAAIGSPFGLTETMTSGIVSAIDRTITAPNNFSISGAIQTDAPINHGNSGGPLLTTDGQVIGVNAQIESDSGGNDGVGFALAINNVKSVANTIIAGGVVQHAYMGIHVGDAANGGAKIASVQSGSPAAAAGLQAGDVITALDGKPITSADDLTAAVAAHAPKDKVTLTVTRNGKSISVDVTLGVRPS